jgi:GTP 3',8-cyclase
MQLESSVSRSILQDRWHRQVSYMRISLIEHCNYACTYCMPAEGWTKISSKALLSFDEIVEIIEVMAMRGLQKIRFTGGEPLLRKRLYQLIAAVKQIPGIQTIALTTNGHLLSKQIEGLLEAGLTQLNVSLDTFNHADFKKITRGGELNQVLDGIRHAQECGLNQIKLNAVLSSDIPQNGVKWLAFCLASWQRDCIPRFIETMPMGSGFIQDHLVQNQQILAHLQNHLTLIKASRHSTTQGPATYWQVSHGRYRGHKVGFINPMSDDGFCHTCNRIRLSATGQLRACLADDRSVDLKTPLRMGLHGPALIPFIESALYGKKVSHAMRLGSFPQTPMTHVGG